MQGSVKKFKEMYNNGVELILPYYQRRSVWNPNKGDQLSTLVDDMLALPHLAHRYYIGSAMIQDLECSNEISGASKYFLLDGQQRLTMITIILLALYIKADKKSIANIRLFHHDRTPILTLQREDRDDFNLILSQVSLEKIEGDSSLISCWNYICDRISEFSGDPDEVINCINNMDICTLIVTNDDNPQMVFDRENGGGVRLTIGELTKNMLYQANEEEYYKSWHPTFCSKDVRSFWEYDTTREGMKASDHNIMIDRFLHIVVRILCWRFKDHQQWTSSDRVEFVKEANIYSSLKQFVERFGMSKADLANEICMYGRLYQKYFDTSILDKVIPSTPCIERIACFVLGKGCYVAVPYILYVLSKVDSLQERNKIFEYLENYLMRLTICKNENATKRLSEFFSERLISSEILTAAELKSVINSVDGRHYMPTDADILESLENNNYKPLTSKVILYMHESKTGKCNRGFSQLSVCSLIPEIKISNTTSNVTEADIKNQKLSKSLANTILVKGSFVEDIKKAKSVRLSEKYALLVKATIGISTSTNFLHSSKVIELKTIEKRISELSKCYNNILWPVA